MPCPIAGYKIDESAARWVAGFVVAAVGASLFATESFRPWIFAFLVLDFGVRAFSRPRWSPFGRLAGFALKALRVPPRVVDAGPKRFAARIGLGFSAALLLLVPAQSESATRAVAGLLAICAFLEASVGFCLGCAIYGLWYDLRDRLSRKTRQQVG